MIDNSQFALEFLRRFGIPLDHVCLQGNQWTVAVWDKSIMPKLHPHSQIQILEKLWDEFLNNPKTGIRPKDWEQKFNILHKTGMTHSGQLGTAEVATTWTHTGVGTSNAAENQDHTALTAEVANPRKSLLTAGQRKAVNQTQKFSMPYFDTDLTVPVTLREYGIFNASVSGVNYARVTSTDKLVSAGDLFTFILNVIFVNGIVV